MLGWTASFSIAGVLSLLAAVAVWMLLDDKAVAPVPVRSATQLRSGVAAVSRRVADAWALPGTRLGFWAHFACMASGPAFGMLWGLPYLVQGAGFASSGAGLILMVSVLVCGVAGPAVGWFIARWPNLRIAGAFGVCATTVLGWLLVVFVLGAHPPRLFVAVLFVITMIGAPASMVAFALARDYNSARIIGTASGVVNVGGFVATAIVAVAFGAVLTMLGSTSPQTLRWALLVPVAVQAFGMLRVLVWARRLRTTLVARQRDGITVPVRVQRRFFWDEQWPESAAS